MKSTKFTYALLLKSIAFFSLLTVAACSKNDQIVPKTGADTENLIAPTATQASYGEVTSYNGTWTAKVNGVVKYKGTDYMSAIQSACNNLTPGRTTKETVVIKNSGSSGSSGGVIKAVNIPSNTILDFNGTTFNCNSGDALIIPVQGDRRTNIEVKNLKVTGNPRYGIWFKGCSNMIISNITMSLSAGLGIRVDHSTAATKNLTISGSININGSSDHGIETYGLDGFNIGNVTVNNSRGGCGLLLNQSRNGTVGTVTGSGNNPGGGYATFRVANNNGPNVKVSKVYSRNSGRGFFSVSGSNGCTVTTVDIASNSSHGIFLEDASYTYVNGGTVSGCRPNIQHVRTTSCVTKVNGKTYTARDGKW